LEGGAGDCTSPDLCSPDPLATGLYGGAAI
jgi:hypothetical protein